MRAVVDTNIIVRAIIKPEGTVAPILTLLSLKRYTLVYSAPLFQEVRSVLHRARIRKRIRAYPADIDDVLSLVLQHGELVTPVHPITACRDPKDNMLLEVAVEGRADVIVSGDNDLLVLSPFEGIQVVSPAEFLARVAHASAE